MGFLPGYVQIGFANGIRFDLCSGVTREVFSRIPCTGFLGFFNCVVFKRFRGFDSHKNVKRSGTMRTDQSTVLRHTCNDDNFQIFP